MAAKIGHASISENGTMRGKAGDQSGREVCTRNWYKHSKGWVLLRCKDARMRAYIAEAMEKACANDDIGYDQLENQTLWNDIKGRGYVPGKTTQAVETDCARLVRVCCQYACEQVGNGKTIPDFYTATEASTLKKTGLFDKLTASKYTAQDDYLLRGDILVTKTKGHTAVVLTSGSKASAAPEPEKEPEKEKEYALGERLLKNGCEGADVAELQSYLNQLGYDSGDVDGEFGDNTEQAVEQFQWTNKLEADGKYGAKTHAALMKQLADRTGTAQGVKIVNGNCYVRTAPSTDGKKLGTAKKGEHYSYGGMQSDDGWYMINYRNKTGWVSGMYGELTGYQP